MQAVVHDGYGSPDVLRFDDVDVPIAADDEVLVRVVAASINPGDWDVLRGSPYILRPMTGFRKPRSRILGLAVAGQVESVGAGVRGLQRGDEVYAGIGRGGFAQYARVPQASCALKPRNLTFEQAAAVPVAGTTALQALRDVAQIRSGQNVLINGASGGVGTFAVQIAKAFGADVTGVCSAKNADLVRSIGADHVVDYSREDFTRIGVRYDLIFDNVGNRSLSDLRRALKPSGILIPNSNKGSGRWIGGYVRRAMTALVVSPFVSQKLKPFAATEKAEDLAALAQLIESGQITPVIERTYPFRDTADALRHYGGGHTKGKVVITMERNDTQNGGG